MAPLLWLPPPGQGLPLSVSQASGVKRACCTVAVGMLFMAASMLETANDSVVREELATYLEAGTLSHLGLAVSRDDSAEFKHVQDAMMANAAAIAKCVHPACSVIEGLHACCGPAFACLRSQGVLHWLALGCCWRRMLCFTCAATPAPWAAPLICRWSSCSSRSVACTLA